MRGFGFSLEEGRDVFFVELLSITYRYGSLKGGWSSMESYWFLWFLGSKPKTFVLESSSISLFRFISSMVMFG